MENVPNETTQDVVFQSLTELVGIPSKGYFYPIDHVLHSGEVEMKLMTARDEDITKNISYLRKGIMFDKLLKSLIKSDLEIGDLLIGDRDALIIKARILAYGSKYEVKKDGKPFIVDLKDLQPGGLEIDESEVERGVNKFEMTLPKSNVTVTFKLLTVKDEKHIENEVKDMERIGTASPTLSELRRQILSVNGNPDRALIAKFVEQMPAMDSRALRKKYNEINPRLDLIVDIADEDTGEIEKFSVPYTENFFSP